MGLAACAGVSEAPIPSPSPPQDPTPSATSVLQPIDFACPDPTPAPSESIYSFACVHEEGSIRYLLVAVNADVRGTLQELAQGDFDDILEKGGLRFVPCQTVVWTHAIKAVPTDDNSIPCWEPGQ